MTRISSKCQTEFLRSLLIYSTIFPKPAKLHCVCDLPMDKSDALEETPLPPTAWWGPYHLVDILFMTNKNEEKEKIPDINIINYQTWGWMLGVGHEPELGWRPTGQMRRYSLLIRSEYIMETYHKYGLVVEVHQWPLFWANLAMGQREKGTTEWPCHGGYITNMV